MAERHDQTEARSADAAAGGELTITVLHDPQAPSVTWTLTCDPPGGTHPDAEAACAALATVPTPFAPVPAGMMCAQMYGGPQTATVTGTWRGQRVDASYRRTDGCEIARWRKLGAVLSPGQRADRPLV